MVISPKNILKMNNFTTAHTKDIIQSLIPHTWQHLQLDLVATNVLTHLATMLEKLLNLLDLGSHLRATCQN